MNGTQREIWCPADTAGALALEAVRAEKAGDYQLAGERRAALVEHVAAGLGYTAASGDSRFSNEVYALAKDVKEKLLAIARPWA